MNPKLIKKKNLKQKFQIEIPTEIFLKGKEMVEAYYNLFIFENFFRLFIENVAKVKFGLNYWKKLNMNKKIQDKINDRKEEERIKRWLSIRGDSDLFYADLIDLKTIISSNWEIFKEYFPKEVWITSKLEDLYDLRNKIAHNSYLDETEQKTVESIIGNIYAQLKATLRYEKLGANNIIERDYIRMIDEEEEEDLYINEKERSQKRKKIDFELIFNYLDMIRNSQLSPMNLIPMLNKIHNEFAKISYKEDMFEDELDIITDYAKTINKYILGKDNEIIRIIVGTIRMIVLNPKLVSLIRKINYSNFEKLYERGYKKNDIALILYKCGKFESISTEICEAIDKKDINSLKMFRNLLYSTKIEEDKLPIIRKLRLKIEQLSSTSDLDLIEIISSIINYLES